MPAHPQFHVDFVDSETLLILMREPENIFASTANQFKVVVVGFLSGAACPLYLHVGAADGKVVRMPTHWAAARANLAQTLQIFSQRKS